MNNSRALLITFFLFGLFIVIALVLFNIQIINHDKYGAIADRQQNKLETIKAERGTIKDRNNELLAYTMDDVSFFVDTRMATKKVKDSIAVRFSSVFGKSKAYYLRIMNKSKGNVCLEKKASRMKSILLNDLVLEGFYKEEDYSRRYPYGRLASHILGYVDRECNGVNGIEKEFDKYLTGSDGCLLIERDVLGRIVSVDEEMSKPAYPGNNLVLTINKSYQQILEEELGEGLRETKGKSATGIIMNPNTGEILALANIPNYDPSSYNSFTDDQRRNRAVCDTYEPGSTMKALVMSMLLENDLVKENQVINTENGIYKISGATVRDTKKFPSLTVREIFEQSSNIGMTKLSNRFDDKMIYKFLRDFGFGNIAGITLPSEAAGFLKRPEKYSKITKVFMSFGYELSATPLQMATAFCALVNGGDLIEPRIVKQIVNPEGEVIKETNTRCLRSVISEKTSKKIIDFMIGVVENGTGEEAQLENVMVGGKTGTTQKIVDGNYSKHDYNSSFIGFFPAENPKVVCLILIDSPEIGKYGGKVAAPIFHDIAVRLLEADPALSPEKKEIKRKRSEIENMIAELNSNNEDELFITRNLSGREKDEGNGKAIENPGVMPDLKNKSVRDAISLLVELGIKYDIKGSGKVMSQSIPEGTKINGESICHLVCNSDSNIQSVRLN